MTAVTKPCVLRVRAYYRAIYNRHVGQPSKAGAVFLFLFALPFFGFGLFFALVMLSSSPSIHKSGNPIAGAALGFFFALIGLGFMIGAIYGYQKQKQQAATQAANPDSPWLWRSDWAENKALSQGRNTIFTWWIGTILVSMIAVPLLTTALPPLLRNSDPKALVLIGFCIFPLILLTGALRSTIRRERYGKTYFEFGSLPFAPGRRVTGQIQLRLNSSAQHGVDLRLSCIRRIVTGSGKERTTNEVVLWQEQTNVPQNSLSRGPLGTAIPVDFGIPQDAYETNHENISDQLLWMLHAQADVAAVDYADNFEIPVFRAGSSVARLASTAANFSSASSVASSFSPSFGSAAAATAPAFESDSTEVPAPGNPKTVISTTADGSTEFYFPALRNWRQAIFLFLFTAIWTGVVYFLFRSQAPRFFSFVFGFSNLLLIYGCFQTAFGTTRIIVGSGKISSTRKIFGPGTTREFPFGDVQSVLATMGLAGTSSSFVAYSVRLQTKSGKGVVLADNIADRQEARWIVSQIEKLAGLKLDTHVALQDSFGQDYSAPPQRTMLATVTPQSLRRPNKAAGLIGFLVFAAWTGFIVERSGILQHRGPQSHSSSGVRRSQSTTATRVTYAPMTDADVERIEQLPIQDQAEELLDRAIQHQERALDIFEAKVGSPEWLGRIRLSERMKDLERRSEFSTDLRVRYANADLNLSMDGWSRTDHGADLLIERARTDAHYRPAAVYFLGMMAGREVAYDRIYPVLLNYAKHDPDPNVRVWAVEGMRYLGTDEALDELFNSFVSDPSEMVRNRAGCNVSDCGNFKRVQRMRMVPELISLTADPATAPQTRNWSFLALHEITGENLPNYALAWQNWYDQHGAEKLAQFEQAPWWQVLGNE